MSNNSHSLVDQSGGQDQWSASDESATEQETEPQTDAESVANENTSNDSTPDWGRPDDRKEAEPDIIDNDVEAEMAKAVTEPDAPDSSESTESTEEEPPVEALQKDDEESYVDLDLAVMQVNYTTEYIQNSDHQRAWIHLFCRTPEENELVQVDVYGFYPYFYVPPQEAKEIKQSYRDEIYGVDTHDERGNPFESIRGQKLHRVKTHIPRTVGQIRDDYDHYEADVLFPDRFMIDKGIESGVRVPAPSDWKETGRITVEADEVEAVDVSAEPRIHNVDIEVEDRNGFPEPEDADEEVICITAHDSVRDEYVVWYYEGETVEEPVPTEVNDYEFIEEHETAPEVEIRTFDTEDHMLADYVGYLDQTEPDLLVGWNVDEFDAEYLINRMEKINDFSDRDLNPDRLSRINEVWGGGWRGPNVKGRVVFDLLEAYKRTQFSELDSYRLDAIGEIELDVGKEVFDGDIGDLWEHDPEQLIEYNLRDVEICVELDRQQDIIDFWDEVRQFVGCRLQDAPIPGDAVDMYVLQEVNGKFVLPSKGTVETGEEYEGGAVFDPMTGIEENVTVLDLKSLYPMCMVTINASPETKVLNPEEFDGETYVAPNGVHYRKDQDGIIRDMVNDLLGEREKKKELRSNYEPGDAEYELYDRQQGAVKVIMNSLYGVSGWDRFRLYDKDNAAAVTATGRGVIEFTEEVVEQLGYEVAYGDTDSVMISLGDLEDADVELSDEIKKKGPDWSEDELKKLQAGLNQSFNVEEQINEAYNDYALDELNAEEHRFQIEFEKLYKRFLQAGKKKRYGGHIVWKEGKFVDDIDITGFEYQRSDIAAITKVSQKKLIDMLVTGEDLDEVRSYLHDLIEDVRAGEVSIEEIGIPSGIGQPLDEYETETAHVRGAKYANLLLGTNLGQASKPKRLYLERVQPEFYRYCRDEMGLDPQENPTYAQFKRNPDVICFIHEGQIPEEFEIDWDKMLDKTLKGPLSRVLKAVDITWEDVKSGQEQTGLESFM